MKTIVNLSDCGSELLKYYNSHSDFETAWNECPRGDWMLCLADKLGVDKRKRTLAAGHCANTARHFMEDERSKIAVDVAIAYGEGKATEYELRCAYENAFLAYNDARTADNTFGSYIAYQAANAAYIATYTATHIPYSTNIQTNLQTADICRKYLTEEVLQKYNQMKPIKQLTSAVTSKAKDMGFELDFKAIVNSFYDSEEVTEDRSEYRSIYFECEKDTKPFPVRYRADMAGHYESEKQSVVTLTIRTTIVSGSRWENLMCEISAYFHHGIVEVEVAKW